MNFITEEMFDELKTFELYPDDVWIVTYPKCGTTWTQQIVKLIRSRGERDDVKINASIPWPEAMKFYPGTIFFVNLKLWPVLLDRIIIIMIEFYEKKEEEENAVTRIQTRVITATT